MACANSYLYAQYRHCFVRSYGWYEDQESVFVAMEYIGGGDLQRYLDNSQFSEQEAVIISRQLLEGLAFMHENGFAHRDIKPQVRFIDFRCVDGAR